MSIVNGGLHLIGDSEKYTLGSSVWNKLLRGLAKKAYSLVCCGFLSVGHVNVNLKLQPSSATIQRFKTHYPQDSLLRHFWYEPNWIIDHRSQWLEHQGFGIIIELSPWKV